MSETLVFVLVVAVGFLGLTVGLQPLLWSTRRTSASSWGPPAFSNSQVMQSRFSVRIKRVPSTPPVRIRRIWVKSIQEDEKKPTVLRIDEE